MSEATRIPILVVEDEAAILSGLCDLLAFHGYAPTGAERGDTGLELGLSQEFSLVILDVMLPGMSGFDVCTELRKARPDLPILMLTARGSEEDVIQGFRCGSDDYVTKPFSLAELLARVQALLRRSGALDAQENGKAGFTFGGWEIDPSGLAARSAEAELELTRLETGILSLLSRERGHIVSRRQLLHEVWGYPNPDRVETRTVDMHIVKLRRKLGGGPQSPIETVRGEGYRYSG